MAKTSYEKALDKQVREANKRAAEAALRDRASARINAQQVINGFHILESSSEEVLQKVLDCYDGNENHRVSGTYDIFPEYLRQSLTLEFEILRMCGIVATSPRLLGENWQLYLTPQGKNYFDNKEISSAITTGKYDV